MIAVELVDVVATGRLARAELDALDRAAFLAARRLSLDEERPAVDVCAVTEKLRHQTQAEARRYAVGFRDRRGGSGHGTPARAYPCDHCGGWHLSTKQRRRAA